MKRSTFLVTGLGGKIASVPVWKNGITMGGLGAWAMSFPTPHLSFPMSFSRPFDRPPIVSKSNIPP